MIQVTRRRLIRQFASTSRCKKADTNNKEDSLIYQKLKQLAEESRDVDRSIHTPRDVLSDTQKSTPEFQSLVDNLKAKEFKEKYAKEFAYHKIPEYASRHSKEIALAQPWTGTESTHDANLRMLSDAHKPLQNPRPLRSKLSTRDRLHNAREGSLDYSLAKISSNSINDKNKNDGFNERYREALLGPELLGPVSTHTNLTAISGLVDRKIEEAKSRGAFLNLKNRGKPLPKDHNANSPYIDTTVYHLNNILKGQDIVPPWIDKQGSVKVEIDKFREELDKKWLKRAVIIINEMFGSQGVDVLLQKVTTYSNNEVNGGDKLRDSQFLEEQDLYLTKKIAALNDSLRGYNLQAPMASQKRYLMKEKELDLMFERVNKNLLYDGVQKFLQGDDETYEVKQIKIGNYLNYNELPQRDGQESLGKMFLNIFKRT